eukprot:CAMPEP_0184684024 /NCGR_PEP_ID=MMETSP0312-20130426/13513_1 /TAXON_ID=31354 /ORGANISM="Compsopogon coeruleus, Strain SAG 36.94" /LENGTH=1453 /DNA_ID=CAMNT_0027136811 /DNA_START=123 /DNA_END=4484 /DNA_ORIENTATION=+
MQVFCDERGGIDLGEVSVGDVRIVKELRVVNTGAERLGLRWNAEGLGALLGLRYHRVRVLGDDVDADAVREDLASGARDDGNLLLSEAANEKEGMLRWMDPGEAARELLVFDLLESCSSEETADIVVENTLDLTFQEVEATLWGSVHPWSADLTEDPTSSLIELPVRARVCRSLVTCDVRELRFDTALAGIDSVKDFSLRNISEIPASIRLRRIFFDDTSNDLEFVDYNTRASLGTNFAHVKVSPFSTRRIRVSLVETQAGNQREDIIVSNMRNRRNRTILRVQRVAITSSSNDMFAVNPTSLDFGDCYLFNAVSRMITLRNLSSSRAEVFLDSSSADEVYFELVTSVFEHGEGSRVPGKLENALRQSSDSRSTFQLGNPLDVALLDHEYPERILDQTHEMQESNLEDGNSERRNRVDEISLRPGQTKSLRVWYRPLWDPQREKSGVSGSLSPRSFVVSLRSEVLGLKTLQTRARVCPSLVQVEPILLDMGDCPVQTQKTSVLRFQNISDLPAHIRLEYVSKCVTIQPREFTIGNRKACEVSVLYVPRKVNPNYSKQINVINTRNRSNDAVVVLRANVVDLNRVTAHSLYYQVLAPAPANEIDFGISVESHPIIRSFKVRNVTSCDLQLRFHPNQEISLFRVVSRANPVGRDGSLAPCAEDSPSKTLDDSPGPVRRTPPDAGIRTSVSGPVSSSQSPWTERITRGPREENEDLLMGPLSRLESSVGEVSAPLPTFFANSETERAFAEATLLPIHHLTEATSNGYLERCERLTLTREQEVSMFALFTPLQGTRAASSRNKLRAMQSTVRVFLESFDPSLMKGYRRYENDGLVWENTGNGSQCPEIPPRELIFTIRVCRSEMDVEQKNLNFGTVLLGERKRRRLVITNKSEAPLLFSIRKSGSVASGDIHFDGVNVGVVRPYSAKEVPFLFSPTLVGRLQETLLVENLLDPRDEHKVIIKALVFRKRLFILRRENIANFGLITTNEPSKHALRMRITNDSDKTRKFTVQATRMVDIREGIDTSPLPFETIFSTGVLLIGGQQSKCDGAIEQKNIQRSSSIEGSSFPSVMTFRNRGMVTLGAGRSEVLEVRLLLLAGDMEGDVQCNFSIVCFESKNKDDFDFISCTADLGNPREFNSQNGIGSLSTPLKSFAGEPVKDIYLGVSLDRASYDLGEISVGTRKACEAMLTNRTRVVVFYRALPSSKAYMLKRGESLMEVVVEPASGEIVAGGTRPLCIFVSALGSGRYKRSLHIFLSNVPHVFPTEPQITVDVQLVAHNLSPIRVSPLDVGVLDLGVGVLDDGVEFPLWKKVVIENLTTCEASARITSNLSGQIKLFTDELTTPLMDFLQLPVAGSRDLWVALLPRLPYEKARDGFCRQIVGGLKFVISMEETRTNASLTIPFRGKIIVSDMKYDSPGSMSEISGPQNILKEALQPKTNRNLELDDRGEVDDQKTEDS